MTRNLVRACRLSCPRSTRTCPKPCVLFPGWFWSSSCTECSAREGMIHTSVGRTVHWLLCIVCICERKVGELISYGKIKSSRGLV